MSGERASGRVLLVVERETDASGVRLAYVNSCPHGEDLGLVRLAPPGSPEAVRVWEFADLGGGRCRVSPSLLAEGAHAGAGCHFGPGEFDFVWLEPGQHRNRDTGLPEG